MAPFPPLAERARALLGTALDQRAIPLGVERWPAFAEHLHAAPTGLLDVHWPLRSPDRYHLNVLGVKSLLEDEVGLWLVKHGLVLIATGPNGDFITLTNDEALRVTFVSMSESIASMDEGAPPPPGTTCAMTMDVFDLLERLETMHAQSVRGTFPDDVDEPLPLDFYDAQDWDPADGGPADGGPTQQ